MKEFAVNATKEEGEFYTPHDVVQLIATVIEPFDGTLYDPCCGSGCMFIQSTDFVKAKQGDISRINVYGQEKEAATYRLAKMNLAYCFKSFLNTKPRSECCERGLIIPI